jgi:replicative DNA helicase
VTDLQEGPKRVVTTPFPGLNYLLHGGFHPGELVLLGARPGAGKSALEMLLARHAAREKHGVTVVSKEMSELALGRRLFSQEGGVHAGKLRAGTLDRSDWTRIRAAQEALADLPIWMTDKVMTVEQIVALAQENVRERGIAVLAVDYLQLVMTDRRIHDKRLSVEFISQSLKALAVELNIVTLVLSSLNRAPKNAAGAAPGLHDLREAVPSSTTATSSCSSTSRPATTTSRRATVNRWS